MDKYLPLLVLAGLLPVSLGLGRVALRLVGRPLGPSLSLTRLLVSALTGSALLMLALGTFFHLGVIAPHMRWPLVGVLPPLALLGLHDLARTLRRRGPRRLALLLGFASLAATGLVYLPYGLTGGLDCFSDTPTYPWLARWLQHHSFATPVVVDDTLSGSQVFETYQFHQLRMGSTFLLAACQALVPRGEPMGVYLGCLIWGILLNLAGIYLLARWGLGFKVFWSAAAAALAAVTLNPLYLCAIFGFFPQEYGTAYLTFCLALLARSARPRFQIRGHAVLLGLSLATIVSVYSELVPVPVLTGLLVAGWLAIRAWRGGRFRAYLGFALWTLGAAVVLGHVEWLRAWHALAGQAQVVVGGHLPGPWPSFWALAAGVTCMIPIDPAWPDLAMLVLMGLTSLALLLGLGRCLSGHSSLALVLALMIFAALTAHFLRTPDPFRPGELGHRWSLFKLAKWVFPLCLVVQCAGWFPLLLRGRRWRRRFVVVALALLIWTAVDLGNRQGHVAANLAHRFGTTDLPRTWKQLQRRLDHLGVERVHYLPLTKDWWPDRFLCYLLEPRPLVNGWGDHALVHHLRKGSPDEPLAAGATPLFWGNTPFPVRGINLPGRLIALDPASPHVLALLVEDRLVQVPEAAHRLQNEQRPVTFLVWSPQPGKIVLSQQAQPGTTPPRIVGPGGETLPRLATDDGLPATTCTLPAGFSRLHLHPGEKMPEQSASSSKTELGIWRTAFAGAPAPSSTDQEVQGLPPPRFTKAHNRLISWTENARTGGVGFLPSVVALGVVIWSWRARRRPRPVSAEQATAARIAA